METVVWIKPRELQLCFPLCLRKGQSSSWHKLTGRQEKTNRLRSACGLQCELCFADTLSPLRKEESHMNASDHPTIIGVQLHCLILALWTQVSLSVNRTADSKTSLGGFHKLHLLCNFSSSSYAMMCSLHMVWLTALFCEHDEEDHIILLQWDSNGLLLMPSACSTHLLGIFRSCVWEFARVVHCMWVFLAFMHIWVNVCMGLD